MKCVSIQSIIEKNNIFRPIRTGWLVGKCPICNDYKERAGFKFENGNVIYNCWNCPAGSQYEEYSGQMSKKFRKVLLAFGIDEDEISSAVNSVFFFKKEVTKISLQSVTTIDTSTPEIKLPDKTFPLGHDSSIEAQLQIADYLLSRNINLDKYPFFFSLQPKLINRVIIPYYRNNKLIYWQARSILSGEKKKWENSPVRRDGVMFNYDQLQMFDRKPLFVTEGVFDAMLVDGIALLGSVLNDVKKSVLEKSRRRLIFIIDKDSNGRSLANAVLNCGWEIAFVPDGAEDLSDSVRRFGLSWSLYELMKSIPKDNDNAQLLIKMNCR